MWQYLILEFTILPVLLICQNFCSNICSFSIKTIAIRHLQLFISVKEMNFMLKSFMDCQNVACCVLCRWPPRSQRPPKSRQSAILDSSRAARAHYVFSVRAHLPKSLNSGLFIWHRKCLVSYLFFDVINIVFAWQWCKCINLFTYAKII